MKHVKLNNGHQLAILNLIYLEVFRGIHVYFMNIPGMLVRLYCLAISNDLPSLVVENMPSLKPHILYYIN